MFVSTNWRLGFRVLYVVVSSYLCLHIVDLCVSLVGYCVCIGVCVHVCVVHIYEYVYAHLYLYVCTCMRAYAHVYAYVCARICVYMHNCTCCTAAQFEL